MSLDSHGDTKTQVKPTSYAVQEEAELKDFLPPYSREDEDFFELTQFRHELERTSVDTEEILLDRIIAKKREIYDLEMELLDGERVMFIIMKNATEEEILKLNKEKLRDEKEIYSKIMKAGNELYHMELRKLELKMESFLKKARTTDEELLKLEIRNLEFEKETHYERKKIMEKSFSHEMMILEKKKNILDNALMELEIEKQSHPVNEAMGAMEPLAAAFDSGSKFHHVASNSGYQRQETKINKSPGYEGVASGGQNTSHMSEFEKRLILARLILAKQQSRPPMPDIYEIPWYHPGISRQTAEDLLLSNTIRDGTYLLRDCVSDDNTVTLSVRFADSVKHFKVVRDGRQFFFGPNRFPSLEDFKQHFMHKQVISTDSGVFVHLRYSYHRNVSGSAVYYNVVGDIPKPWVPTRPPPSRAACKNSMSHPASINLSEVCPQTVNIDLKQKLMEAEYQLLQEPMNVSLMEEFDRGSSHKFKSNTLLAFKEIIYNGQDKMVTWDCGNLQLNFSANGLPEGKPMCSIKIAIVRHEHLQYPDDTVPASLAYYIISSCNLTKPIKVTVNHFASEESIDSLMFARGSIEDNPPYTLHTVDDGSFTRTHGEIYLQSFSFLEILYCRLFVRSYLISLMQTTNFSWISSAELTWKLYLSVIKNCESQQRLLDKYFSEQLLATSLNSLSSLGACVVRFQTNSECIELKISKEEEEIQPGWYLKPNTPLKLYKSDIDHYNGRRPPVCVMKLRRAVHRGVSYLNYSLTFKGIEREDDNFIDVSVECCEESLSQPSQVQQKPSLYEIHRNQIKESKKDLLCEQISEGNITMVAEKLEKWEPKIEKFGLERNPFLHDIKEEFKNPLEQRIQLLHLWRQRCDNPTYDSLLRLCANENFTDSAKVIVHILNSD